MLVNVIFPLFPYFKEYGSIAVLQTVPVDSVRR